jgi:hypothetical protein
MFATIDRAGGFHISQKVWIDNTYAGVIVAILITSDETLYRIKTAEDFQEVTSLRLSQRND